MSMSIPNNEIWVKTSDNHIPRLIADSFNVSYVNTTSQDGWYIFHFDGDITTIGSYAINGDVYITDIILPETVIYIGKNAFNGDSGLKNINFPESLYGINSGAFSYCTGLTSLEFKHVVQIDTEAFMGCYNLTDIEWGDSLYRIGQRAFYSNNMKGKLKTLTIPATVGAIDPYAFSRQGIENLFFLGKTPPQIGTGSFANNTISTVTVPYVGKDWYITAFASHTTLAGATIQYTYEEIDIPEKETYYWQHDDIVEFALSLQDPKQGVTKVLKLDTEGQKKLCNSLNGISEIFVDGKPITLSTDYTFDSAGLHVVEFKLTTTTLPQNIFQNNTWEVGIIGSKITEISDNAFKVTGSPSIISYAITPPVISDNTFDIYDNWSIIGPTKRYLYVPAGTLNDYKLWMSYLGTVTKYAYFIREIGVDVPELVLDGYDVAVLFQPVATNGATKIYNGNVDSVVAISIYGGAEISGGINEYTFPSPCEWYIVRYKFTDSTIPHLAFSDIGRMYGNVVIGTRITSIGVESFYQNGRLNDITIPNSVTHIGSSAFRYCNGLRNLELPYSVSTIDESAFYGCINVTNLTISNSVTRIGDYAFNSWDSLKTLHIPSSVTYIGYSAFSRCLGLTDIYVEDSDNSALYGSFAENPNLTSVYIGASTLEDGVFYDCPSLTEASFGSKVKYIGYYTFGYAGSNDPSVIKPSIIKKITCYSRKAPTIVKETFQGVPEYGTLYYPQGSDYSTWLSSDKYYLGYYHWNGETFNASNSSFELEYYSLEVPQIGMITTLDVTSSQITEILIEYPWWAVPKQKDGYFEIDIEENDGLPRTGEMIFTAISEDGERITQTLTINQKGIEDMATSIALYKTRLDFPAEGGSKYVQVDYINASVINAPYCSQSWVTIQQTQAGTAVDGNNTTYQRMYKITMESASFARQINVKFSCTSPTGAEISTDKLMLYQAAPTVNPDDGEGTTEVHPYSTIVKVKIDGTPEYSSGSNLGVGYENLTPSTPDVDSSWIHLGVGVKDDGVSSYDTVMRYPVTYDENEGPERTGYITFKGIDGFGNVYTATTEVTQYGTDTPVDEGMIELQSLSMTLPAEGGSDNFVVKYYDAKTIYDPEFVGDWATITEVSTTSENGVAFNGTECVVVTKTYKVTAQPTTTGRVAKVILRADINYYDGGVISMERDRFRVNQLASGSEEIQGIVYPFRNTVSFNHKGIADSWSSIKVGYKDLAVDTPQINVDWFRVKSVTDKTYGAKEYDYIYEYELEVDENIGTMREGTITFIGNAEDGTRNTGVVKVIQLGYESDIDTIATNYKGYFKSMDGALYSVAFVTNPNYDSYGEITLAGESPVVVSYTDNDTLYEPVRTSTCTVRVISKQYLMNLYSGKAQGTQVILKNEDTGTIEWCGYLQPNLYNQGYSSEIEEIEFEASDCLSTLQYLKYEDYYVNGRMPVPFSYIIGDMLDKTKLIKSYYMTQKPFSDGTVSRYITFNLFQISEHNFFSEEGEPWSLLEVLEETCKFFGYVCYQWGDSIYFMDYDRFNDSGKMMGYRYDKSSDWSTKSSVIMSDVSNTITADSYRDTGADMSLDDIFNKVSVNCNYYNIEDIIPDLFDDELLTNRQGEGMLTGVTRLDKKYPNQTWYRIYDHENINSIFYSPVNNKSYHEIKVNPTDVQKKGPEILENFVGANIVDILHLNYHDAIGEVYETKDWERYLLINQLNRPWAEGYGGQGAAGPRAWETYNLPIMEFKNLPTIFLNNTEISAGKPRNYLVIDAEAIFTPFLGEACIDDFTPKGGKSSGKYTDTAYMDMVRENPALCFYLEIPKAGWWNGSGWVDYKTYFEVPLEELSWTDDKFYNTSVGVINTVESKLMINSTGYKIPLPEEMDSTEFMYFAIGLPKRTAHLNDSYGADNTGTVGNAYCFIKNLKVSIENIYSTLYAEKDEVIENVIDDGNVIEGPEIDLKITSDNGHGYSLSNVAVMGTDDVLTTSFDFYAIDNEILKPEEAIIQRYVNQYSTPSVKENVTLDMSFKPYQLINDSWWDKNFVMIGQEIDYKDSKQTITLLEKK